MELFGIRFVGINQENGEKLIASVVVIGVAFLSRALILAVARLVARRNGRALFWTGQAVGIGNAAFLVIALLSVWFDNPARLTTAMGLVTAGIAFALQRVITALAGYLVILRGRTFTVGDRISMGGVRGDVIRLSFIQTTIMEMGQPPAVQNADPAMWIRSRQYTGRIVTVTNDKVFQEPVYNYTTDFPYVWEEMVVPIPYDADRVRAERILLEVAARYTAAIAEMSEAILQELERRFFIARSEATPRVYLRLTDNWLEMTLRYLVHDHGMRVIKDAVARDVLELFDAARIAIASSTMSVTVTSATRAES